ncbi:hypothetical protein [Noviherbaspirillum aerium]|uniref:hypothetical protein n=1 Tax=Noviherbaspirillum aerium TaxID=2588497 RepID=UPI001CEF6D93|nr:hypothetical protein [Noviherbaspirillum aerium]
MENDITKRIYWKGHRKMAAFNAEDERMQFSKRLQQSLDRAGQVHDSPTALARFFNSRYDGQRITVHAARKWLVGEAIPTQEKLRVLAQWLEVPLDWLRFGGDRAGTPVDRSTYSKLTPKDQAILENIRKLDNAHQEIVITLIHSLVRVSKGIELVP